MSKLHDLQCSMGRGVLGKDEDSIVSAIMGDGLDPAARLNIYRNHYNTSLSEALKATYPAVCRLVDERFFAYAASEYIKTSPPRRVCLFEYGDSFPMFLAAFPACANLAYLPDVARLEWMMNATLHAPAPTPIDIGDLAHLETSDYPRLVFALQPALRLIESAFPIDRIWRLNQPATGEEETVNLAAGDCRLEIRQLGDDVVFRALDCGEFTFRAALAKGRTLEAAVEDALAGDPMFDTTLALRRLFTEGLVIGFTLAPFPNPDRGLKEISP